MVASVAGVSAADVSVAAGNSVAVGDSEITVGSEKFVGWGAGVGEDVHDAARMVISAR